MRNFEAIIRGTAVNMFSSKYMTVLLAALLLCGGCVGVREQKDTADAIPDRAAFFSLGRTAEGRAFAVSVPPSGGLPDTLLLEAPLSSVVCMSSTSVAAFCAIGAPEVVTGVSGRDYISSADISAGTVDVGFEAALDYEAVLSLAPDLVLAYSTSAVIPDYVTKLRALGVRVFMIYDHLESHPLARAEYLRLYGCIAGKQEAADSVFAQVSSSYHTLSELAESFNTRPGVLVNVPYADAWYIPGRDNFFSTIVRDAGGELLGSRPGHESSVITLERALSLASAAEVWLNPGWALTRGEIASIHPLIASFPVLKSGRIFNNIKRSTPAGGNDFYEGGAVRPDLVLSDLIKIIHPEYQAEVEGFTESNSPAGSFLDDSFCDDSLCDDSLCGDSFRGGGLEYYIEVK